jgi:hypothetical protein
MRDWPTELRRGRKGGIVVNRMFVAGQRGKLRKMIQTQRGRFTAEEKAHSKVIGEKLLGPRHVSLI